MFALHYHDATKHGFDRFARALGYLDWASQPNPFRRFDGAPLAEPPEPVREFLRLSLGLSAWKQYGASRWALRVNPSSGNLHPTEGYIVASDGVYHYAPREHAVERRCAWDPPGAVGGVQLGPDAFVVGLTSIHWREAWKYGERAFRYCQHDAGHAIAALRIAAGAIGWTMRLLAGPSHAQIAAILGVDRDDDFGDAEREEAECLALVTRGAAAAVVDADADVGPLVAAARRGRWAGRANRLSTHHVEWPIIDEVARATRGSGMPARSTAPAGGGGVFAPTPTPAAGRLPGRDVILRRRSALAFDGHTAVPRETFVSVLRATLPGAPPCDTLWWPPQVHLALFVHRVDGLHPGIYAFVRDMVTFDAFRAACRPEFLWEPMDGDTGAGPREAALFLLVPLDCRRLANRLSCDQAIAADGFFSLGMIARFEPALRERGEAFYRNLFWEAGFIGQVLYLAAEAAGARGTGIGCYYDDPVHEVLGLSGRDWQSLYHFSIGAPIEDSRLTSEPGYAWE